jgi:hypothetical protein
MAGRSPEIQAQYTWLQKNFPDEAERIFITTVGTRETPDSVLAIEKDRFDKLYQPEDHAAEKWQAIHDAVVMDSSRKAWPRENSLFDFSVLPIINSTVNSNSISLATTRPLTEEMSRLCKLHHPEEQQMLYQYTYRQELVHAVDDLQREFLASDSKNIMEMEATGDAFSALDLLKSGLMGEYKAPVRPFLEKIIKMHHDLESVDHTHALTDDAMAAAIQWADLNPETLKEMSPQDMLEQAREIAKDLATPQVSEASEKISMSTINTAATQLNQHPSPCRQASTTTPKPRWPSA